MILVVDFDGTLALGNKSHITSMTPNWELIERMRTAKKELGAIIKICTARGAKSGLTTKEKEHKYQQLIEKFLAQYSIPYDVISFNKEYGDLYIDDMTISPKDDFSSLKSPFTQNDIIFTEKTVIKKTEHSLFEYEWYKEAKHFLNVPNVLFCNDETIITERIYAERNPNADDVIGLLEKFASKSISNSPAVTYRKNIPDIDGCSKKTIQCLNHLNEIELNPTFFHGDLSTKNIIINDEAWLIDSNYKNVFGNYLTDAGKSFFSFIAYEANYSEAVKIKKHFGQEVLYYAVYEGLRVCKYKPNYISIVNNISDLI